MPFTEASDGVRLHYEVFGKDGAEPLLMIQGLGADSRGWLMQRAAFRSRYRCITLDNRGVGASDKPPGPYSLPLMADDACRVLDAAGFESAHVMGASMGGALAQMIAVLQPHRVRSLVLACTACRNPAWRRELLEEWIAVATARGMRAYAHENARWLVGPRSLRRFSPLFDLLGPLAISAPAHSFVAQTRAILDADDAMSEALATLSVPALVIVGSQDILTPVADAEEIAELIPDAELVVIRGAAHGFMVEAFRPFNRAVLEFLDRVTAGAGDVDQPAPGARRSRLRFLPRPVAASLDALGSVPTTVGTAVTSVRGG
jgi:3-oxoadipate enol-lactonase